MNQLVVCYFIVVDEFGWLIAGEIEASFTDKFHSPVVVIPAAICHSWQVAHQRLKRSPALKQAAFGKFSFGYIADNHYKLFIIPARPLSLHGIVLSGSGLNTPRFRRFCFLPLF